MNLILALLFACNTPAEVVPEPIAAVPEAAPVAMVFADDHGRIRCPVMGDVIADKSAATSHVDYKGTTYYFCCSACSDQFAADPGQFANGSFLRANGLWEEGAPHDETCNH